jgi:hypothetical protein
MAGVQPIDDVAAGGQVGKRHNLHGDGFGNVECDGRRGYTFSVQPAGMVVVRQDDEFSAAGRPEVPTPGLEPFAGTMRSTRRAQPQFPEAVNTFLAFDQKYRVRVEEIGQAIDADCVVVLPPAKPFGPPSHLPAA